jgi:ADP-ribosylglycohydrolase
MRTILALVLLLTCIGIDVEAQKAGDKGLREITRAELDDRIRGGWAGQMIGVSFGAPTEFKSNGKIIEGPLPVWKPSNIANAIDQDDLYVEMTFAEVMDRLGLDATTEQYGEAFRDTGYNLWHANAAARRLLANGIKAPWSGHPRFNSHANDIDFQIESDFIGLMAPGLPNAARDYSIRVGQVMNFGDGLYGGLFVTGMYAAAFFERDVRAVVEAGLALLPAGSGYAAVIRDVLAWHRAYPSDWRRTWQLIQDKWDRNDACPDGSLRPFNIDARLNGAYIALGLLYGGGDFARTLDVTTRAGQDSDCNPSNAAGILGVMLGYGRIPDEWKSGIPALAERKFAYTSYSFDDIVASTLRRAEAVVTRAGGEVTPTTFRIPLQAPVAPVLEQWDMGPPEQVVEVTDAAWQWAGGWQDPAARPDGSRPRGRLAGAAGADAVLTFTGTAVTITGVYAQDGGRAEVTIDGQKADAINSWIPARTHDNSLWHVYGLAPGTHTVRIATTGTADERSTGTAVHITGAIVYAGAQQAAVSARRASRNEIRPN